MLDSSPKIEKSVFIYLPSCHYTILLIFEAQTNLNFAALQKFEHLGWAVVL